MKSELLEYPFYQWPEDQLPQQKCIGNNAKQLLVLASSSDIPQHLSFLKKILRAIGYDFENDLLFGTLQEGESLRLMSAPIAHGQHHILLFGVPPTQVGLFVHDAQRVLTFDKTTVILAPALATLASDERQKRALWGILKQNFQP